VSWEDEIDWDSEVEDDPYKYVLGLDPGGTTGVALLRYTDDTPAELGYLHQIPDGLPGYFRYFINSWPEDNVMIVSEQWEERNVKGADRIPTYIEGAQYAMWYGTENLTYQSPKMKSLVPDEWLAEQNLWTPGKRHQMDALIHAIVYLRNSGHKPTIEALSNRPTKPMAEPGEAAAKTKGDDDEGSFNGDIQVVQLGEADPGEAEDGQGSDGDGEASDSGAGDAGGNAEPGGSVESDPTGDSPSSHGGVPDSVDMTVKGTRKRRERNGVFTGYDTEGEESVLYAD
jgi:hypothetical protein